MVDARLGIDVARYRITPRVSGNCIDLGYFKFILKNNKRFIVYWK
jgi:hypothetical protein